MKMMPECFVTMRNPVKTFLVITLRPIILVSIFLVRLHAMAQAPNAPAFAVATIKPGKDLPGKSQRPYAGGYEATRVTVEDLISYAYDLPWGTSGLISGGPRWAYTDTFDIEAKSESAIEGKSFNALTNEQIGNLDRLMIQSLLASRFKLKVHHDAKPVPGFSLTVVKGGPKLNHSGTTPLLPSQRMRLTRGDIQAWRVTMGWLAGYLQFQPEAEGYIVADNTGLVGEFDISLRWFPEGEYGTPAGVPVSNPTKEISQFPGLYTALQEQLGLKLERTRVPADTIVIDSIEKPSGN
jgi:uncharacterized protein (TIGR03435 family)